MVPNMWKGAPDTELADDVVLPAQLRLGWRRPDTAERRLAFAVLWTAVLDLYKHRFAKRHRQKRLYMEAWDWIASNDRSWEFSFERLCEELEIEPAEARAALLDIRRPRRLDPQTRQESADGESAPPKGFDHAA